jgi:hypothetical protein
MKLIALIVLSTLTGCVSLPPAEYAYQALHLVDAAQTFDIKNHAGYHEENKLLGKHPTDSEIAAYMAAEAVVHGWISVQLESAPKWVRYTWHSLSIGWEGKEVIHNSQIGLRVRF